MSRSPAEEKISLTSSRVSSSDLPVSQRTPFSILGRVYRYVRKRGLSVASRISDCQKCDEVGRTQGRKKACVHEHSIDCESRITPHRQGNPSPSQVYPPPSWAPKRTIQCLSRPKKDRVQMDECFSKTDARISKLPVRLKPCRLISSGSRNSPCHPFQLPNILPPDPFLRPARPGCLVLWYTMHTCNIQPSNCLHLCRLQLDRQSQVSD